MVSVVVPVGGATKLANSFDEAGRCVNWLTKLYNGGCFVGGTKVTLSEMPRSSALNSQLWAESNQSWFEQLADDSSLRAWLEAEAGPLGGQNTSTATSLLNRSTASGLLSSGSSLLIPIEEVPLGARVPTGALSMLNYCVHVHGSLRMASKLVKLYR